MKQLLPIVGFYILITVIAYTRPLFQKILAEHQKQIEAGLERNMSIEGFAPASRVVVPPQGLKVLARSRPVKPLARQVSVRKGSAPEGSLLVHTKAPARSPSNTTTKKMDSLGNDPVS